MKTHTHNGLFVLRTPLLPWSDAPEEEKLGDFLRRPEVREAILLGNPRVAALSEKWLKSKKDSKDYARILPILLRTAHRMSRRAMPQGLHAGVSLGKIESRTEIFLSPRKEYRKITEVGAAYLSVLAKEIETDKRLLRRLKVRTNPTVQRIGDQIHFWKTAVEKGLYKDVATELPWSPDLQFILDAANGTIALHVLLARARKAVFAGAPRSEIEEVLIWLMREQALLSDFGVSMVGGRAAKELAHKGRGIGHPALRTLAEADSKLNSMNSLPVGQGVAGVQKVRDSLTDLLPSVDCDVFHSVLVKPTMSATLGVHQVAALSEATDFLHRCFPDGYADPLSDFKTAFEKRFGDLAVPLEKVFNEGFDLRSCLHESAGIFDPRAEVAVEREMKLRALIASALLRGETEIRVDESHLPREKPRKPLPDAYAVIAQLWRDKIRFLGMMGPSGMRTIARFAHDPEIFSAIQKHFKEEEALHPDALFAEISHKGGHASPDSLRRPIQRNHVIALIDSSFGSIPIGDLTVALVRGRFRFRSKRLKKEIIPRLSNAHNVRNSIVPLYRFLDLCQNDGLVRHLSWNWGALESQSFLPRVVFKNIIFSMARWTLSREQLQLLKAPNKGTTAEIEIEIEKLRQETGLPRWIAVQNNDQILPIDLESPASRQIWLDSLPADVDSYAVSEWLPMEEDKEVVRGPEGAYANEIIVPFTRMKLTQVKNLRPAKSQQAPIENATETSPEARLLPGSECLYARLFCGETSATSFILKDLAPLLNRWREKRLLRRWFYVRYNDPEFHIRLRIFGASRILWGQILRELNANAQRWIASGNIWKLELDTYMREMSRYGGAAGIGLAEKIFDVDSRFAVELLTYEPPLAELSWPAVGFASGGSRIALLLLSADSYLRAFGLTLEEREAFCLNFSELERKSSSLTLTAREELAGFLRRADGFVMPLMERRANGHPSAEVIVNILSAHERRLRTLIRAHRKYKPGVPFLRDVIHMNLNRLSENFLGPVEPEILYCLGKIYRAAKCRGLSL